jgi:hypothetical protein
MSKPHGLRREHARGPGFGQDWFVVGRVKRRQRLVHDRVRPFRGIDHRNGGGPLQTEPPWEGDARSYLHMSAARLAAAGLEGWSPTKTGGSEPDWLGADLGSLGALIIDHPNYTAMGAVGLDPFIFLPDFQDRDVFVESRCRQVREVLGSDR